MSATTYFKDTVLNYIFRGGTFTQPTSLWVALGTTSATVTGVGTEVSTVGTAYAREAIPCNTSNWNDPTGNNYVDNILEITFEIPTANWGTVISAGLFDAVSGGNCLFSGDLTNQRQILDADPAPKFVAGELKALIT